MIKVLEDNNMTNDNNNDKNNYSTEHMPQTYKFAYNQSIKTLGRLAVT